MKHFIEKWPTCKPIKSAIHILDSLGFIIIEQKLADFHFKELYFKLSGDLSKLKNRNFEGMQSDGNKLICECHWSTIELFQK